MSEYITRSVSIDVWLPETHKEKHRAIVDSIRHYRAVARHTYALLFEAQAAGADFDQNDKGFRLKPNNERAKQLMALAMDKIKEDGTYYKAPVYEVREYVLKSLAPNWIPFVFDSLRQDVYSRWKAPDTEFPKAQRGFMSLQGARGVARFQRIGIGFPQATAKPRLEGHSIFLKWDRLLDEIEFKFEKLDSGRYWTWKQLTSNPAWSVGTVFLSERDGALKVIISYTKPAIFSDLVAERQLVVDFSDRPESFIRLSGPDGEALYDSMSALGALGGLDELKKVSEYYDRRKQAMGNKRAPWGLRKGFVNVAKTLNHVTQRREAQIKDWNHRWTRRIIENEKRWRCGKVIIQNRPSLELFRRPWQWAQFEQFLKYKVEEIGGRFEVVQGVQSARTGTK